MARFLAIDVGAGTLDAMFLDTRSGDHFKFVAKSPTRILADKIEACRDPQILLMGRQMGGGPVTEAIRKKVLGSSVMLTRSAAQTIHHRMEKVEKLGATLIPQKVAQEKLKSRKVSWFKTGDVPVKEMMTMLKMMGVEPAVDFFGIAVQDHGTPKKRISTVDFRHSILKGVIEESPKPSAFLFASDRIPSYLRRMRAAAMDGRAFPSGKVYVMDTGMAAILGASSDRSVREKRSIIVLDIATSHTLGALLVEGEIGGFFEYHTVDVTPDILKSLIVDLADGKLSHKKIRAEGGHGAYVRRAVGLEGVEIIVVTGPKRKMLEPVGLDKVVLGAPFGDNMMTGTAGLILAMAEKEGIALEARY